MERYLFPPEKDPIIKRGEAGPLDPYMRWHCLDGGPRSLNFRPVKQTLVLRDILQLTVERLEFLRENFKIRFSDKLKAQEFSVTIGINMQLQVRPGEGENSKDIIWVGNEIYDLDTFHLTIYMDATVAFKPLIIGRA